MSWDVSRDLESMLNDSPYTMTVESTTKPCFYDEAHVLGDQSRTDVSQQRLYLEALSFRTSDFPSLASSGTITVKELDAAGAEVWSRDYTYRVKQTNGAMTDLQLRRS